MHGIFHIHFNPVADTSQHTDDWPLSPPPSYSSSYPLCVKCDDPAITSKNLEDELSFILDTRLSYSGQNNEYYMFKFLTSDLNFVTLFSLSTKQEQLLSEAGVQQLQCGECNIIIPYKQSRNVITPHVDLKPSSDNVIRGKR